MGQDIEKDTILDLLNKLVDIVDNYTIRKYKKKYYQEKLDNYKCKFIMK